MRDAINAYIETWKSRCYHDDIPDEIPVEIFDLAPSYKRICFAILKNDLSVIGIDRPRSVYYNMLKHIELKERGKITSKQLDLF